MTLILTSQFVQFSVIVVFISAHCIHRDNVTVTIIFIYQLHKRLCHSIYTEMKNNSVVVERFNMEYSRLLSGSVYMKRLTTPFQHYTRYFYGQWLLGIPPKLTIKYLSKKETNSQQVHDIKTTTSNQRRCDVGTSHRR